MDEAIRLANDVRFGLGSSIWTNDEKERSASSTKSKLDMVFINKMVASDPRIPFGGVKAFRARQRTGAGGHSRVRECENRLDRVEALLSTRYSVHGRTARRSKTSAPRYGEGAVNPSGGSVSESATINSAHGHSSDSMRWTATCIFSPSSS